MQPYRPIKSRRRRHLQPISKLRPKPRQLRQAHNSRLPPRRLQLQRLSSKRRLRKPARRPKRRLPRRMSQLRLRKHPGKR